MTNDYWDRVSAPHADRDRSEREPSTDPTADVAEPEHRMVPPDASDLRWRCSGCRWTASDAFTSPEHRMVMWAKAHPEPTPERGDEDRVGVALVGEYAEVLDMWLPRYLRRIWTEHGEARDVIEAIEVLIEQGLASACVQVEKRHTAKLLAEVTRLRGWKAEAIEVIRGLQELGKALGLRLGERITGEAATEAATRLTIRAEAAEAARDEAQEKLARVERALDDELANLADDGARLSHSVVRRIEAALRGPKDVS